MAVDRAMCIDEMVCEKSGFTPHSFSNSVDGTNAAIAVAGGNVVMRSTVGSPQSPATLGATWSASSVPGGISFKSVDALGYDVVSSASLLLPSLWALIAAGVSVLLLQL
mmetsp:Transcript_23896/g.60439  ORF Transcript_23896/g.60439 Transcript_23896/m.60439 type:complete len:109 (-) Transcript_23896:255-581(-)